MAAPTVQSIVSPDTSAVTSSGRLLALDAWRGLTVLLMLLVNNVALGSLTPAQLRHAPWGGGVTLTDMVFPWFLFCAGTAIPFVLAATRKAKMTPRDFTLKLASRTALLFLVGCFVVSAVNRSPTFGLGVLQVIALASLVGALGGLLTVRPRLALAFALLLLYALVIHWYPLPGGVRGAFEEGRNAISHLNSAYLEPLGLRGMTSVVPTGALVLLGSVAGEFARSADRLAFRRLLAFGLALTLVGLLWSLVLPFNKPVWTSSYIAFSAGLGTLGLLACFSLERFSNAGRWLWPLLVPGRNALFAYVAPILFKVWVLQSWTVNWTGKSASLQDSLLSLARSNLGSPWGGLAYTAGYILVAWLALWWMYRKNWLWKL
ncbi:acyltransferase family protein [Deinococcus yavapaiensis]|uniref:Putative acyltransferase n=1 Tax=Deinococcus yavapaiensis KR-236 TaxID=694435 RepID=A0A318SP69_9DEIO|nr:DUF5009 domain-containing protein [Deinococcus yavapaiensis]PYE54550.1 putative acyltransferase [Deinococcus yavapaiensis KR-236]